MDDSNDCEVSQSSQHVCEIMHTEKVLTKASIECDFKISDDESFAGNRDSSIIKNSKAMFNQYQSMMNYVDFFQSESLNLDNSFFTDNWT